MTAVTLFRCENGIVGLESQGHADRAPKGEDIVCAAVSALVQALVVGVQEVAGVSDVQIVMDGDVPLISVKWPRYRAAELRLLSETIAISLKKIESGYPGYVKVLEVRTA